MVGLYWVLFRLQTRERQKSLNVMKEVRSVLSFWKPGRIWDSQKEGEGVLVYSSYLLLHKKPPQGSHLKQSYSFAHESAIWTEHSGEWGRGIGENSLSPLCLGSSGAAQRIAGGWNQLKAACLSADAGCQLGWAGASDQSTYTRPFHVAVCLPLSMEAG